MLNSTLHKKNTYRSPKDFVQKKTAPNLLKHVYVPGLGDTKTEKCNVGLLIIFCHKDFAQLLRKKIEVFVEFPLYFKVHIRKKTIFFGDKERGVE